MLRNLIALVSLGICLFWGAVFAVAAPVLAVAWFALWGAVLALDYRLHLDTSPSVPVVTGEVVGDGDASIEACRYRGIDTQHDENIEVCIHRGV